MTFQAFFIIHIFVNQIQAQTSTLHYMVVFDLNDFHWMPGTKASETMLLKPQAKLLKVVHTVSVKTVSPLNWVQSMKTVSSLNWVQYTSEQLQLSGP